MTAKVSDLPVHAKIESQMGRSTRSDVLSDQTMAEHEMAERLGGQIRSVLMASPFIDIQQIEVDVLGPRLVLSGRLESYYHKQLVQQAIRFAYPLTEIIDDLRVFTRPH